MIHPSFKKSSNRKFIFILILCCVGTIIYSNTFTSSFHFDDHNFIIENFAIKKLANIKMMWDFWSTRFIPVFTFALNYHFNHLNVFGYHLVNLVIHLGSGIAAFWLITLLLSTPGMKNDKISGHARLIAFLGALVFLSHPIQTESVTYIFHRVTCLAGFFYLFSLCFYIKSRLSGINGNPLSRWGPLYLFFWLLAILGMLTKENTITLPLMIVLCEFCFFETGKGIKWSRALPFLIILPIIPVLLFFTNSMMSSDIKYVTLHPINEVNCGYYLLTQFRAMSTYIRLLFFPINQNPDYDYPIVRNPFDLPALASFLFLVIILIAAIRLFRRYRLISFSIFWFFLTLLPELGVVQFKKDVIFEHWLYLAVFGYGLFLVSSAYYLFGRNFFKPMVCALLVIVACYSVLTYHRNFVWKDEFTLWNDTVLKSPGKARPYSIRGITYALRGDPDKALSDYNKAIEINPKFSETYNNRGLTYFDLGNFKEAIANYNKAVEIEPKLVSAYVNRGNVYFRLGNFKEAVVDYSEAIKLNSSSAIIYDRRGQAYYALGNIKLAIFDFSKAIEINPKFASAYNNRGNSRFYEGNIKLAISDFTKAIEINPGFAIAYDNRGIAYGNEGNLDRAISDFTKAIEINPGFASTYNNRSVSYFQKKDYDKSWEDVHKSEKLGYIVNSQFIAELKEASKREK